MGMVIPIINNYSFVDNSLLSPISYYRLKQIDFDGKYEYSKTIIITSKSEVDALIYPNPTENNLYFNLSETSNEIYTIIYSNAIGVIKNEKITISKGISTYETKEFRDLSPGIYFVQILNEDLEVIKYQKIIKK